MNFLNEQQRTVEPGVEAAIDRLLERAQTDGSVVKCQTEATRIVAEFPATAMSVDQISLAILQGATEAGLAVMLGEDASAQ